MNNTFQRELEIFEAGLKLTDRAAREQYLVDACRNDADLCQRVRALLEAHEKAGTFLLSPPDGVRAVPNGPTCDDSAAASAEQPGDRIGRYKLLQQIGEGGMGVVYMAEQQEPVHRRVALKIIKLGMDTRQVVARFEAERQALALMDHPNIARVLDGGATETGRPYFVMELVQGVPITEFCERTKMPAKERLKLFVQVCQAVQSAHQKGIIHRDIKPSNVLVTLHDGVPVPKVIDFGIAKATNQKLTEKTLFTNFATMIGTPAYMSPEQAEMSGLDIDTRTDIYALGVLLYALLTGTTPFPEKRLRSLGYGEMQRVIIEEEPERPSTRLSTMAHEQRTLFAQTCGEELNSLSKLLKGDLDWIVMKCLEKDRQRRYETANGLAADIQRHLTNEPVVARPPSVAYRFQKVLRRNKLAFVAAAFIALTLIVALGFITTAFVRERRARYQAAAAERANQEAHRKAEAESVRADDVAAFVNQYFGTTIADLMDRGDGYAVRRLLSVADHLAISLSNAPSAAASVRFLVGVGYSSLMDQGVAAAQFRSLETLNLPGEEGRQLKRMARAERVAATMWDRWDTNAASDLRSIGAEALAQRPPETEVAAVAFCNTALFYADSGADADAEFLARETLRATPDDVAHRAWRMVALDVLAAELAKRDRLAEAHKYGAQLLRMGVSLQSDEGQNKKDINAFVDVLTLFGRYIPTEAMVQEVLPMVPKQTRLHVALEEMLAYAILGAGDWQRGQSVLAACATNEMCSVQSWGTAVAVAGLRGDQNLVRSLCGVGLIHYGARSDFNASRMLAEGLLIQPPDPAFLPLIRELLDRSLRVSTWRNWTLFALAQLDFRTGQFAEAAKTTREHLEGVRALAPPADADMFEARGRFLLAEIEMKLNHPGQAREAYQQGLRLHQAAGIKEGTPLRDLQGAMALDNELLKRETASVLGDQVPATP